MNAQDELESLVAILRLAYSGELAAAHAYAGHWRSVRDPSERERIRTIEREELLHREQVGAMLAALGRRPSRARELRSLAIGWTLRLLCPVSGWFAPMWGAGRLESRNVREYEAAARHAARCGREGWVDRLLTMAEVEWDHERYFRERVLSHRAARWIPIWPAPPARQTIRASFAAELGEHAAA